MRNKRCYLVGGLLVLAITAVVFFSALSTTIPLPVHGVRQQAATHAYRHSSPFDAWREPNNKQLEMFGHVITLGYTGQQIAGIRALLSQQCWIASFSLPMKIVEPYTNGSCLVHSSEHWRAFDQGKSMMRFSDYFSKDHFNVHSTMTRNPPLVSWEEFLESASRKVIAVTIDDIHHKGCLVYSKNTCQTLQGHNRTIWNAFTSGCRRFSMMTNALEFLERKGFKVVRNVCLNCHIEMSQDHHFLPNHVTDHIFGEYNPSEITLVIHQWRFSMQIIPNCQPPFLCMDVKTLLLSRLRPNPEILRDADEYMVSTLEPDKLTIAVMVRIEWYLIMHRKSAGLNETIRECLQSVTTLFNDLKQRGSDIQPFLTLDVGKYGSSTLHSTLSSFDNSTQASILSSVKSFVSELYDSHLTFDEWERTFTVVSDDRGYVAALQRTIAAKASCLISMGGGHFQEVAFQDYLWNHPNPSEQCIHHVCMPNNFEQNSQKSQEIFNSQIQNNYNLQQL